MNKIVTTFDSKYWKRTSQYTVKFWPEFLRNNWSLVLHDTPEVGVKCDKKLESTEKNKWIERASTYSNSITTPNGFMKEWKKFSHKSFSQWETYFNDPTGIMIWCDADVKFKKPLSKDVIKECLDGKFCAYLGRDRVNTQDPLFKKRYGQYKTLTPETCFIIYDLDHTIAKDFFTAFRNVYISMELFKNFSWCDAGAFIRTVNKFNNTNFNDITSNSEPTPLPLNVSPLDNYIEHWIGTSNKKNKQDILGAELKQRMNNGI